VISDQLTPDVGSESTALTPVAIDFDVQSLVGRMLNEGKMAVGDVPSREGLSTDYCDSQLPSLSSRAGIEFDH
jgi:hypothetical protein